MADRPTPTAGAEEHRFPCPTCGADLRYDPGAEQLVCHHCGHVEKIAGRGPANAPIVEHDFRAAVEAALLVTDMEETRTVTCQSCGAEVEFDPDTHARECPFCASPIVTDTGVNRHVKPGAVLPFALDQDAARAAMRDWLGQLWLAPGGLRRYARRSHPLQGIYVPYWTFDADTRSEYSGERGTAHTRMRTVVQNGKRRTVPQTEIRWARVRGRVARAFDDVLVLASRSLPARHTDALQPWQLAALEPYAPEYLAGFRAEAYQVELREGWTRARAIMDGRIERDVRFDIGGDRQRIHQIRTDVSNVTFKHVLLPVWVAAYTWRGKPYRFVVNGQTGRVAGERPWSPWKVAAAVILALLLAAAAAWFYAQGQGGGVSW